MKILLDTCVWGKAREELQSLGHDVVWTGEWEQDPGDEEILTYAFQQQRVLVTLDKDYGELAIHQGMCHYRIVRLVDIASRRQAPVCQFVLERYGQELLAGAIVTVEPGRVRIRPADEPPAPSDAS